MAIYYLTKNVKLIDICGESLTFTRLKRTIINI